MIKTVIFDMNKYKIYISEKGFKSVEPHIDLRLMYQADIVLQMKLYKNEWRSTVIKNGHLKRGDDIIDNSIELFKNKYIIKDNLRLILDE